MNNDRKSDEAKNQTAESAVWSFNKDATAESAVASFNKDATAESAVASFNKDATAYHLRLQTLQSQVGPNGRFCHLIFCS